MMLIKSYIIFKNIIQSHKKNFSLQDVSGFTMFPNIIHYKKCQLGETRSEVGQQGSVSP